MEATVSRALALDILKGLMGSEHMGDVHKEIKRLHDLLGIDRPQGNHADGWTDEDWSHVEEAPND